MRQVSFRNFCLTCLLQPPQPQACILFPRRLADTSFAISMGIPYSPHRKWQDIFCSDSQKPSIPLYFKEWRAFLCRCYWSEDFSQAHLLSGSRRAKFLLAEIICLLCPMELLLENRMRQQGIRTFLQCSAHKITQCKIQCYNRISL